MGLSKTDPQVYKLIKEEEKRQREVLEMIPSENYASHAVMEALGTVLTNKYSEGYPKKRYYQGNRVIDEIEQLAIDRAKKLFGVPYVNVQALSGSPANTAVYFALLTPLKDKIMGLSMASGGHLTHGLALNISGRFYKSSLYELGKDGQLDYAAIEKQAVREKPKIIICGYTAFPRIIDFKKFGQIADKVGAFLMADISHITGLVVAGAHPSPVPYAHIITTTTHKTLRGPRGALIMVTEKGFKKDPDLGRKIDSAIIPGLQGGPHDNQTAAIAVALKEASAPAFKKYGHQIVKNSKALAKALIKYGFDLLSGGSDNHLILIDLQNKKANGAVAAFALEVANIVVNKNLVLNDPMPSFYPSGIRLGTPAITTRGMKEKEMTKIAGWYSQVIDKVKNEQLPQEKEARVEFMKSFRQKAAKNKKLLQIAHEVKALTQKFPV
ncbi:serine hydroxymethyltransferase [Candidatus Curtissbacteria bacterium RIFCSPHIGHO2_01_FULL_41_44]|uniref:Serine hydroxymethyltransferase n=1 Tax=Candidatus Curtissbacteria bacterium RIFCSPLOWO2_01_FULL_42_50 TaxID=1797730 RepID=A0A1F5H6V7_9BACT|nr:MAG: serine hydroxymethyltransferase [Candidatus Curtissbacteria bacterium RIFCSPHIGHO2_02_FULL_42_58]OGD94397.1 MAG: serine hydroxymethyltransferase [Candidatus Curtissbacteria bacterium RIFCSPHIGHO2_01_FULL_41_44]OGD97671.1 MAG: serine hydroxymethyltransferase [Candidatus Curtissbacteria bacterium RIFCSPHIGHO2_12_FULL_42_33]OGD99902.1 MAG: serine hydroxymethyltransferase [Candidatus Curtissbacteria bacterium RIFCSPLOWO2_01_FULL_42_50]OGE02761.1 MAG: serine hydroxymethyltransferase [Candida